ncbi:MAG: hypothetical protein J6V53_03170 [Alphaproteobacteria bacterium]|nr:hypothetical protein [Alphaproteobacteria bacterium]
MNKFLFIVFACLTITGCNSFMCEFKSPNEMTDREFELCKAEATSTDIYVR